MKRLPKLHEIEKLYLLCDAFHSTFKSELITLCGFNQNSVISYTCSYARGKGVFSPHLNPDSIEDLAVRAAEFIVLIVKDPTVVVSQILDSVKVVPSTDIAAAMAEYHVRFYILTVLVSKGVFSTSQLEQVTELVLFNLRTELF